MSVGLLALARVATRVDLSLCSLLQQLDHAEQLSPAGRFVGRGIDVVVPQGGPDHPVALRRVTEYEMKAGMAISPL